MYYYALIQHLSDGSYPATISVKQSYTEADAALHYDMWYAEQEQNENLLDCRCIILDSLLNPVKKDNWAKTVELPNDNDEPEENK